MPVRLARARPAGLKVTRPTRGREAELADDSLADCDTWERGVVDVWLRRTGSSRDRPAASPSPTSGSSTVTGRVPRVCWIDLGCRYEAAMALLVSPEEPALRETLQMFTSLRALGFDAYYPEVDARPSASTRFLPERAPRHIRIRSG